MNWWEYVSVFDLFTHMYCAEDTSHAQTENKVLSVLSNINVTTVFTVLVGRFCSGFESLYSTEPLGFSSYVSLWNYFCSLQNEFSERSHFFADFLFLSKHNKLINADGLLWIDSSKVLRSDLSVFLPSNWKLCCYHRNFIYSTFPRACAEIFLAPKQRFTAHTTFSCRYRSMARTIQELQGRMLQSLPVPQPCPAVEEEVEEPPFVPMRLSTTFRSPSRRLWKAQDQVPLLNPGLRGITWCR